jgi:23S rRNA (pseudouridine1915-N3)-methyltransferase
MLVISIGKVKDRNISALIDEYAKRIKRLEFLELKDSGKEKEGERIIQALEKIKDRYVFVLSEEGRQLGSVELAEKLKGIDKVPVFVIGGPDGLSDAAKKKGDFIFSLSRMTFTHEMARLFLTEQLYRSSSILENKRYHRE